MPVGTVYLYEVCAKLQFIGFIPTICAEFAYDTQAKLPCCISQLSAIPAGALARGLLLILYAP